MTAEAMDCFASLAMTAGAMDCFAEPVIGRALATRWLAMTGGVAKNRIDHRCRCATLGDHLRRGAAIRHLINPTVDARI
jgi:hypothetical protein